MKALIDTNIILDVLLERKSFFKPAVEIFCLAEDSKIEAFICATTVTTIDYLLTKSLPVKKARMALSHIISLFEIAPVNKAVIERALNSRVTDFEDAVLEESGKIAGVDCIITRNVKDFKYASIKVFEPIEFLAIF
ncbi:MAG: PIN domain-containing protein [Desulfatiglans sp.]|nr:PIN domain-containing protein [Desulfatiglans sp.]